MKNFFNKLFNSSSSTNDKSLNDAQNDDCFAGLFKQIYLSNEFRFQQQDEKLKMRAAPNIKVTLGMLLNRTFDVREEEVSDLYIVSDNTSKKEGKLITDRDEMWNFDLCEAILIKRDDGCVGYRHGENVTLVLSYKKWTSFAEDVDKSISRRDNTIIIHLRGCGAGEDTFFIRASIIVPVFGYENDKVYARTKNQPQVISVVFAYDETPPEQKIAEYEAVYHSAMEKIRKQETLDFDEYCIATQIRTDIGQDFYWGNKALKENRFWDAIVYFENVYYALQGNWLSNDMSNESQDMFFHTCYLLGFCYAEMKLWEKAIFYLDIVFPLDNASYKMEYINCLVNSGDFRAILVIQKELERVSHSDVNEAPEYYAFLRRRWVYMRIEMNDLDYAEKMLKEMLKEKGNKEFAQIELEHISRLREACK